MTREASGEAVIRGNILSGTQGARNTAGGGVMIAIGRFVRRLAAKAVMETPTHLDGARKSRQRGLTLAEGLFVLVLAAVAIAGAVRFFGQGNQSAKANDAQSQVTALRGAIVRAVPPPSFGSGGSLMTILDNVNAPVLEGIRVSSGGPYRNGWGGDISATGNGATFTISYTGVPGEACLNIATSMRDLFSLAINGSTVATLPAVATTVAPLCTRTGSGATGGNQLDFTFNG